MSLVRRGPFAAMALALGTLAACRSAAPVAAPGVAAPAGVASTGAAAALRPAVITERVVHDTDDPAIWIDRKNPGQSLVVGTDKNADGGLYVFDLEGKIVAKALGLKRPNNVDVEYGLSVGGEAIDIAVVTERLANTIRVYRLPDLASIDGGGIPVFEGEVQRDPMGVAIYKRPSDGAVFAIVGRKSGPKDAYFWQYRLQDDGKGQVKGEKVRAFGAWSGLAEIEAVAVDDALGYVYYSDENLGIRKYAADPEAAEAGRELALFGIEGFRQDREGISIYTIDDGTGYILVSDQQANQFRVFPREGSAGNPHSHPLVKIVPTSTIESDGSDVTSVGLPPRFPHGLFVAMSEGGVFHYYPWPDLAGPDLTVAPGGRRSAVTTP